ncbi:hypothetical protein KR032_005376 [Drosophila birchii]|nr:hypothetical protein KR032_005376 [Drosophila birchii]
MRYIKCSWTLLVLVALFALVTGSCLEYGHSCWGAHGKRSGGKALEDAKQRPGPNTYALDALAEQLYTNNQNNQNPEDNNDDNTNSGPLAVAPPASALQARRVEEERNRFGNGNGLKWTQLLRQQRYQLRQQEQQQQQLGRGRGSLRGYDAAAESWRKLQQALQNQDLTQDPAENEEQPVYELKK